MEKNKFKYKIFNSKLTTIVSISMVLFLIGIIGLIIYTSKQVSVQIKENITINIELSDTANELTINSLKDSLSKRPYTKEIKYISKDDALKSLEDEMGENPMDFIKVNPLPNCFEINLNSKYANNDSIFYISESLKENVYVKNVDYQRSLISEVNKNVTKVTAIFSLVAVILLIISYVLISNTVTLLIYSNRFVINAMKLIGATKHFIRKPYILQSIVIGLLSACLSSLFMLLFFYFMREDLELFIDLYDKNMYLIVFGVMFIAGIVITCVSTFFAMNKYLRHDTNELYYM